MLISVDVEGMHCDACVRRLSVALGKVAGARVVSVSVGHVDAEVEGFGEETLRAAIVKAGFSPVATTATA